jgi:hypothetical protein
MAELAAVGFADDHSTLEACEVLPAPWRKYEGGTQSESLDANILDTANPEPCSASDEQLLKNALCAQYDQCLNMALKRDWPQFTCRACRLRNFQVRMKPGAFEIMGCYRLLSRIFGLKDMALFLQSS